MRMRARYQRDIMGTWDPQSVSRFEVCNAKPTDGEALQMALWESGQPIVPMKQGNAWGGKGLTGKSMEQGHILHTQRWIRDVNKTVSITYQDDGEVLLKSQMREALMSGFVRPL